MVLQILSLVICFKKNLSFIPNLWNVPDGSLKYHKLCKCFLNFRWFDQHMRLIRVDFSNVSLCIVLADNPGPWDWSRSCLSEMQGQVWRLWSSLLAVCTCFLPMYLCSDIVHACGLHCENCVIMFGPSLVWLLCFYPSSSWKTRQTCDTKSIWQVRQEKCHAERALAISCTRPVFVTGAKMPMPKLYRYCGAACHSALVGLQEFFEWKDVNVEIIGCRARDFIFVFVSMQQRLATSHPLAEQN